MVLLKVGQRVNLNEVSGTIAGYGTLLRRSEGPKVMYLVELDIGYQGWISDLQNEQHCFVSVVMCHPDNVQKAKRGKK